MFIEVKVIKRRTNIRSMRVMTMKSFDIFQSQANVLT
jgi:hypothetical protein